MKVVMEWFKDLSSATNVHVEHIEMNCLAVIFSTFFTSGYIYICNAIRMSGVYMHVRVQYYVMYYGNMHACIHIHVAQAEPGRHAHIDHHGRTYYMDHNTRTIAYNRDRQEEGRGQGEAEVGAPPGRRNPRELQTRREMLDRR